LLDKSLKISKKQNEQMVDFFVFPYTYEDILKSSDTRFCVNAENERRIKNMEDKRVRRTLGELESAFVEDYTELKSNDRLDYLLKCLLLFA